MDKVICVIDRTDALKEVLSSEGIGYESLIKASPFPRAKRKGENLYATNGITPPKLADTLLLRFFKRMGGRGRGSHLYEERKITCVSVGLFVERVTLSQETSIYADLKRFLKVLDSGGSFLFHALFERDVKVKGFDL